MRQIKFVDAIREGLREELIRDETVFLIGEAIGKLQGGNFGVTKGLEEEFGKGRIIESPISEACLGGIAVGASVFGMRPVVEIMFGTLLTLCSDEIHNQAGTMFYTSGGKINVPMVIRTCDWMRIVSGPHHCGNVDAWLMNTPGIKVVAPSTPYDAKGLIKSAIRDGDPVIYLEYSPLYPKTGDVPEDDYTVPIGRAEVKRQGADVTVITFGVTVIDALEAAEALRQEGADVEVLDLRTILPYDKDAIIRSVQKTGRVVVAYEGYKTAGVGAEISAFVAEHCMEHLASPIIRVACKDVPNPSNPVLIKGVGIGREDLVAGIRKALEY